MNKVRFNALYTLLYAFIFGRWKNIFKISLYIYCIYKIYMYICCIEIQKQIKMKIQAKDLKVGMTVKYGNVWVLIETLKETTFKNGKEKIKVIGTQLEGVIRRSNGIKQRVSRIENFDVDFKATTKVSVK